MGKRMLMVISLGILLMQGVLLSQAQETVNEEEDQTEVVDVVEVKHYPARELANLLEALSGGEGTHIIVDENVGRLIVQAQPDRAREIIRLIEQLDVEGVSAPQSQPLLCRIYMVEVPPKQSNLKPFTVVLQTPSPVSSADLLGAIQGEDLRIGRLLQGKEWTHDDAPRILIRGVAASNDAVKRMIEAIPESQISDLRWDDEASASSVPAAQVAQLSEQLRQHIHKFLGAEVQTAGYWFGNLSSPGEVEAPIGLWTLQLKTRPAQAADLSIEINVTQNPQYVMDVPTTILSNTIQGKIGKPIIIGYNRDSYGTRTMGAMIILLEPDTAP